MFTSAEREAFENDGFVRLPGVLSADEIEAMRERVWRLLERNGVDRVNRSTWQRERTSHLQAVRRGDPGPHESAAVRHALDAVFGSGNWTAPSSWGQVLVTFPSEPPWSLPSALWHLDHGYAYPRAPILGVNLFLFVADVEPQGGGTLVLKSSPLLVARFVDTVEDVAKRRSKELRKRFDRSHPWLRELTGRAGDAVLCHPWIIHATSRSVREQPRLMRACRVYHRELVGWRRQWLAAATS